MKKGAIFLGVLLMLTMTLVQPQPLQAHTYTISGTIMDSAGRGIDGVTVAFFDIGSTLTSGGGHYSHSVSAGWSGTVAPSHNCYAFTPVFATIGPVTGNTIQDFSATLNEYNISGTVYSETISSLLQGALILSTGGSAISDPDGAYTLTVNCGWAGAVAPYKAGWEFAPLQSNYIDVTSDQPDEDYIGTASSTQFTISGIITDSASIAVMDGVTVTFISSDGYTETTTSGGGHYAHNVGVGWIGTVTPDYSPYYFSPTLAFVGPVLVDVTQNFTGSTTPPAPVVPPYSAPSGDGTHDLGIVWVEVYTGSNSSGIAAYTDYTGAVFTHLNTSDTYDYTITYTSTKADAKECLVATYIDYDGNHVFDEFDGCALHCGTFTIQPGRNDYVGAFTVPSDAVGGETRMRVVVFCDKSDADTRAPADGTGLDGEVEDYTVHIIEVKAPPGTSPLDVGDVVTAIGGRTELTSLLASSWPWITLVAAVGLRIVAAALRKRTPGR